MTAAPEGAAALLARAAEHVAAAEHVLLTCHRHPDGDAIGSLSALAALLRVNGKRFTLYNPDPVPRLLKWLPFGRSFRNTLAPDARYQVTVVVDCGDPKLLGSELFAPELTGPMVVLDHHPVGVPFGDLYVCDPSAASVGVLVARMARLLGWHIDRQAALGLYVSLSSDTGSFRYASTNAEALRLAAELVEVGVDPWDVAERLYERSSMSRYRLLREALGSLERRLDGQVAFMIITHEMVKRASASWDDSIDLVSYTRALDGVECGVLLTPARGGGTRVSMRSKGRAIDAGAVCASFGGGGHHGAAGCLLDDDVPAAMARIEAALAASLGRDVGAAPEHAPDQGAEARDDNSPHGVATMNRLP
ncbi:MAG TPA: DHH family phosphoesterase [Haliangium sp.]|nr:DHH family phosphoesterase [Haliangium sp.]